MARIQVRRGTAAQWTTTNPTLTSGEPGFETDTGFVKWGNGLQAWNDLPYSEADESAAIAALDTRLATVESSSSSAQVVVRVAGDGASFANGAINAALALGLPEVLVTSFGGDVVMLNGSLVINAGTHLRLAPNVRLTKVRGTYFPMLQNGAVSPLATATDAAITLGAPTVVTTSLASVAVVGQDVQVLLAGEDSGYGRASLYGKVVSKTSTAITLSGAASVAVTGAMVHLFDRDEGIEISGGTWDGTDAGLAFVGDPPPGDHGYRHGNVMHLRRIDGLRVHDLNLAGDGFGYAGFYAVHPADITDGRVWRLTASNVGTAVQTQGPLTNFHISEVSGTTGDDLVAHVGVGLGRRGDTDGDYVDCTISGITSVLAHKAVRLSTGIGSGGVQRKFVRCLVRDVTGHSLTKLVLIEGFAGTAQLDVEVSDVVGRANDGHQLLAIGPVVNSRIGLRNIRWTMEAVTVPAPQNGVITIDYHLPSRIPINTTRNELLDVEIVAGGNVSMRSVRSAVAIERLTPLNDDIVRNTTAALDCGAGVCIYNLAANTWKNLYSGATWVRVAGSAPVNTVAPAITGTLITGQTLSCSTGTWTGFPAPTFTRQWYRGAAAIAGATASTYVLQAADEGANVKCSVFAANSSSSLVTADSNIVVSNNGAPVNTAAPLATGVPEQGETLVAAPGTWSGSPTIGYTYAWQRDAAAIAGATASTYVLQAADEGHSVRCRVTATNGAGASSANSNALIVVANSTWPVLPSGKTPVRAWDPNRVTGHADGDAVASVDDRVGTDDLLQATGSAQPLYKVGVFGGLSSLLFDGADDFMRVAYAAPMNQPLTRVVVAKYASYTSGTRNMVADGDPANSGGALYRKTTTSVGIYANGAGDVAITTTPANAHLYIGVFAGAASELRADNGAAGTGNPGSVGVRGITVGAGQGPSPTGFSNVHVGLVLEYASALDAADIAAMAAWAAANRGTP